MSYLVLGLGIVMAVLGGLAISNGYPIIQVERGWASVIAGAVLVSGGVVTLSLGIVVRSLAGVRAALLAGMPSMPHGSFAEQADLTDASQRLSSPGVAALVPTTAATVGLGAVGASLAEEASSFHHRSSDHSVAGFHAEAPVHDPASHPDHDYEPVPDAHGEAEPPHAPPFAGNDHADHYALETPSTADHDLPAPAGAPPGDWLDRAFSELDLHVPEHAPHDPAHQPQSPIQALEPEVVPPPPAYEPAHAEPEPVHEPVVPEPHQEHIPEPVAHHAPEPMPAEPAPIDYVENATHHHAPHAADVLEAEHPPMVEPAPAPPAAPVAPANPKPASPVIGRYEADGTSYTMYADGSIEAQSSAGVYRFASMAELKSFIEG